MVTEFHVVDPAAPSSFRVLGRQRARTLEGRLAGTILARALPVSGIYLLLVAIGELTTVLVSAGAGISVHALSLVLMATHGTLLRRVSPSLSNLLIALTPAPLIRIVSLTSPLAQFSYIQWFTILAVIIYAGIVATVRILKPDLASIGLRLPERHHWPLESSVILAGFAFGFVEYHILQPGPLVSGLGWKQLLGPLIVLYVSTGLLEELLFRGMLQRYGGEALGKWGGIAFATLVFAVLHTGWASVLDVFFVGSVGLIFALVVLRTRSIIGVSISHAITNGMLFLVMPVLAQ